MRMIPCAVLAFACMGATDATAQVRRCVTPQGDAIYTDRPCEALGAVERPAAHGPPPVAPYRGGCARTLRDLVFELGSAINANDVNRLAGLYHWTGMSTRQAYAAVGRLDAVARRPLIDIVPLMPGTAGGDRAAPVGLRLEQTLANGITPSRTVFGLQRHFGCWWLRG